MEALRCGQVGHLRSLASAPCCTCSAGARAPLQPSAPGCLLVAWLTSPLTNMCLPGWLAVALQGCIVNNESSEIVRMFNSEFNDLAGNPDLDL